MEKSHLSHISFDSCPVYLYDMSIEDVDERRSQRQFFKTAKDAANFLGIVPKRIYEKLGNGCYAYHKETKNKYAVRKAPTV
jgi:hypothetical protein